MCLIVNNPQGKILHPVRIASAHKNNPHGVGVMWYDAEADCVHVERGMLNFADFWKLHESLEGIPHAIHFRWRTRGEIGANFCHPFRVLSKEQDGVDLYMMHNGTLSGIETSGGKSDSQVFAERLREKIAGWSNPMDLLHPHILTRMSKTIGGGNKLLFMGSGGNTVIVNADSGWFDDDEQGAVEIKTFDGVETPVWYSNQYSFTGLTSASWYTEPVADRPRKVGSSSGLSWKKVGDAWVADNDKDDETTEQSVASLIAECEADAELDDDDKYSQWLKDRKIIGSMLAEEEEENGFESEDTIPPVAAVESEDEDSDAGTHYVVSSTGAVELRARATGKLVRELFPAPKSKDEEAADRRAKRKAARKAARAERRVAAGEKWVDVAKREGYVKRRGTKPFHSTIVSAEKSMNDSDGNLYSHDWMKHS